MKRYAKIKNQFRQDSIDKKYKLNTRRSTMKDEVLSTIAMVLGAVSCILIIGGLVSGLSQIKAYEFLTGELAMATALAQIFLSAKNQRSLWLAFVWVGTSSITFANAIWLAK
jgi:hypothetical protein